MTCTMVEFKSATLAEARLLINQTAVVSLLLSLFPLSLAESALHQSHAQTERFACRDVPP